MIEQLATAPAEGFVWQTAQEGTARDGRFVRRAEPAFQFTYSPGSRKETLTLPGQVMRMKTLSSIPFSANIREIPPGATLADVGPTGFVAVARQFGAQDIKVHSNKKILLADGTPAYRIHLTWRLGALDLTTFGVSAFKNRKWVALVAHPWRNPEEASAIVESLNFQLAN